MFHRPFSATLPCLALAALALGSCSMNQPMEEVEKASAEAEKPVTPEALLTAEGGSWELVEDKRAPTPEQAHMAAREQVNPGRVGGSREYTAQASVNDMHENMHFRVLRLEREVAGLRVNFKKLLPPLAGLIASDAALDQAIREIEKDHDMAEHEGAAMVQPAMQPAVSAPAPAATTAPLPLAYAPSSPSAPVPAPAAAPPVASAPAGASAVTDIRFGRHPGHTRVVIDLTAATPFRIDLDNQEKLLIVELPQAAWTGAMRETLSSHPLIKSYTAQPNGQGTTLVLELKQAASVVNSSALPPNSQFGHRVFFDLAAAG